MSYSSCDFMDDVGGTAAELPAYDKTADSLVSEDDVSALADLAMQAIEKTEAQRVALLSALKEAVSLLENGDHPDVWAAGVKSANAAIALCEPAT